jgi:ketosteroid isomerase-like protein
MRKILFTSLLLILTACTKEVPETEKKLSKSLEEKSARETVENFVAAYNSDDIAKAVSFFEADYKGVVADSDDVVGFDALRDDLIHYRKQYPNGKWEIKFDEILVSGELAYVFTSGSFLMHDPIEKKMNPIYSERAIRILKKQKNDGWKIFRYMAIPMFSYDQK